MTFKWGPFCWAYLNIWFMLRPKICFGLPLILILKCAVGGKSAQEKRETVKKRERDRFEEEKKRVREYEKRERNVHRRFPDRERRDKEKRVVKRKREWQLYVGNKHKGRHGTYCNDCSPNAQLAEDKIPTVKKLAKSKKHTCKQLNERTHCYSNRCWIVLTLTRYIKRIDLNANMKRNWQLRARSNSHSDLQANCHTQFIVSKVWRTN